MGGYSSGRYRTRNRGAVEQSLRFDMRQLRRRGFIRTGAHLAGTWSWSRGGEKSGAIAFRIDLSNPDDGHADLSFSVGDEPRQQRIVIEAVACRYGGRRFYFICPRTGRRCEMLCCVGGVFASRQFHRLSYASQSEDPLGRLHRARAKAEARALGQDGKPRPRGANRERVFEQWCAYEEAADALFASEAMRRFGRLGWSS
jgi:hypothetical protein